MSENLNQSTQENIIPAYIWHDPRVIAGALHNGVSVTIFGGILKFEMMPPGCSQKLNSEGAKYLTPSDREMKAKPITQEKAKELGVEVIVSENGTPEFIYTKNTVINQGSIEQKMFADINCTGNFTVGGVTQQTTGSRDVTQSMFTNMKAHGDIDLGDLSQS